MPTIDDTADPFRGCDPDLTDNVVDVIGRRWPIRRHTNRQVLMEQGHTVDVTGIDVAQHRPDDRVPWDSSQSGICLVEPASGDHAEPSCTTQQLDYLTTGEPSGAIALIHFAPLHV